MLCTKDRPPEKAMGLIMPPETERINYSPQEELDSLYETDRGYAPRTYFAVNDGKFMLWQMILASGIWMFCPNAPKYHPNFFVCQQN